MKKEVFCIFKAVKKNPKNFIKKSELKKQLIFKFSKTQKLSKWSKEEDQILLNFGLKMKRNKWINCSQMLNNKTSYQCYLRYKQINSKNKKGRWTESEDQQLLQLVNNFGKSWKFIAKIMKTRSNKQIRIRYEEHLSENLNKGIFTKQEDEKLISLYKIYEKKWAKYKNFFQDRSIRSLKFRILYLLDRKKIIKFSKNINNKRIIGLYEKNNVFTNESTKETVVAENGLQLCENERGNNLFTNFKGILFFLNSLIKQTFLFSNFFYNLIYYYFLKNIF